MKAELDKSVRAIIANPLLGDTKVADLAGIRVYKFELNKQHTLLGYDVETVTQYPLKLSCHENFYRDQRPGARGRHRQSSGLIGQHQHPHHHDLRPARQ